MTDQAYNPTTSTGFGIKGQGQLPQTDSHPLSGQQIQAMQKQMAEQVLHIKKDVELRKWAVDQACGLVGAVHEQPNGKLTFHDPVALAKAIHAFLVDGAGVMLK